jgi:hypothetical protein
MFDRPSLHLCMQDIFPANQHAMPAATRERLVVPLLEQRYWVYMKLHVLARPSTMCSS